MGKYLSKYLTEEDYNNNKDTHLKPHVSYIVNSTKKMVYLRKSYIERYFTIEALEDGLTAKLNTNACEYRIDNGDWNILLANANTPSINKGQTLSFKGNLVPRGEDIGIGTFNISKKCSVQGNIMSLLFNDDFDNETDLTGYDNAFVCLFNGCETLIDASNLILPATTLAEWCYYEMFNECSSLTTTPALPATTLAYGCYNSMFSNCTSLTVAPELPATTLANDCYYGMFQNCISLTEAPELPATTLASSCYQHMFYGCTSLTTAPTLPATTLSNHCYYGMFRHCNSLKTIPTKLPATTLNNYCYAYMFVNCTSLTTAPELPAETLKVFCYGEMFRGCSSLNYIKMLATDISANGCLYNWVIGIASSGTFVKHQDMTNLTIGANGIPSGWIVEDYND